MRCSATSPGGDRLRDYHYIASRITATHSGFAIPPVHTHDLVNLRGVPRQNYDLLRNQSDRSVAGFAGSSVSNWDRKSLSVKSRLNGTSSCLDSKAMKRLAGGILARDNSKGMTRDARERFKDASTNAASARLPPKGLRSNSKKLPVPWWKVLGPGTVSGA